MAICLRVQFFLANPVYSSTSITNVDVTRRRTRSTSSKQMFQVLDQSRSICFILRTTIQESLGFLVQKVSLVSNTTLFLFLANRGKLDL